MELLPPLLSKPDTNTVNAICKQCEVLKVALICGHPNDAITIDYLARHVPLHIQQQLATAGKPLARTGIQLP